jgi:hypothetical protein
MYIRDGKQGKNVRRRGGRKKCKESGHWAGRKVRRGSRKE